MITDSDAFETGDDAIEYAHEHISEKPVDDASEAELRDELAMLEAVLNWEKPRHDRTIMGRQTAIQTALDHDHFDAPGHSRKGDRFLDDQGNLVVLDGAHSVNEAIITHYHYIIIGRTGEPDRPTEARETLPEDGDTHWIGVDELDRYLSDGTLRPAEVVATGETMTGLFERGLSPAVGVDYWHTEVLGKRQTEWANQRGADQSTVSENVSKAEDELSEE